MRRTLWSFAVLTACAAPSAVTPPAQAPDSAQVASEPSTPPPTRRESVVESKFGVQVSDPYRWLEDGGAPEVQAWLRDQDALARRAFAALPERAKLRDQLRALSYLERVSLPKKRGECLFYERRAAGQEQRVLYVGGLEAPGAGGGETCATRALLDGASLSPDGTTAFQVWEPSHDGRSLAYVVHPNNADAGELRVRDVASGADSAIDVIAGAKYAVPQWTPDGRAFYYVALPNDPAIAGAALPGHSEVKLHVLGSDPASDAVVFAKTGQSETELATELSHDGRWLFVYVIRGSSVSELHVRDLQAKQPAWVPLVRGHDGTVAAVAHRGRIYLRTTEGAARGRVVRIDAAQIAAAPRKPIVPTQIVPEHASKVLEEASIVGGKLSLQYLSDGSSEIQLRELDGHERPGQTLSLPGLGSATGVIGTPDDDLGFVAYRSFETPGSVHRVHVGARKLDLWYAVKAPVDTGRFQVERVSYPSKDGTPISMFLAYQKGAPRDGSLPFLLSGYGGFNISVTPSFQPALMAWLAAGGGIALPGLRGGGEHGEAWHRAGMLSNKQNVFDDFIAAAETLIARGYTRPDKLAISGRSNGGLLVGAAITQRPELFRVALCGVPVLDMLRFPLFGDGPTWIPEFGSPDDETAFRALIGYSPYHRVRPDTPYPAVLFLSSSADDRVAPLHAWKMTAALQAASRSGRPVLLRVEQHAGHGGGDQVRARMEESADSLAFALHALSDPPSHR